MLDLHAEVPSTSDAIIFSRFPGAIKVAENEAMVFRWEDRAIKVYSPHFTLEGIQKYAECTNALAAEVAGAQSTQPFLLDGVAVPLQVNPIDEVWELSNDRVYTSSRFIPGPNLYVASWFTDRSTLPESLQNFLKKRGEVGIADEIQAYLTKLQQVSGTIIAVGPTNVAWDGTGFTVTDIANEVYQYVRNTAE